MTSNQLLEKAIALACEAHKGQVDKAGEPYILHPLRLMLQFSTNEERIVAVLHDVLEDSELTCWDLRTQGIPLECMDAVCVLTKGKGEDYSEYIERVFRNPLATRIKLSDLEHNSDLSRLPEVTEKDRQRHTKYQRAIEFLKKEKL